MTLGEIHICFLEFIFSLHNVLRINANVASENKVALKTFTIPNLLFTKTKHLNEDWVMEDLESHVNPKSLWPNVNVR